MISNSGYTTVLKVASELRNAFMDARSVYVCVCVCEYACVCVCAVTAQPHTTTQSRLCWAPVDRRPSKLSG